jgi:hypothetical protein
MIAAVLVDLDVSRTYLCQDPSARTRGAEVCCNHSLRILNAAQIASGFNLLNVVGGKKGSNLGR